MIIWILESESGIKLVYKSFMKTDIDEDLVSGFLTAFHNFSMIEFRQGLESIEMAGLRWIYILESDYDLLFIAADKTNVKTETLLGNLNVIKNQFIRDYGEIWKKRGNTWTGDIKIFEPFEHKITDYYNQWKKVETIEELADFLDILGIFQRIFIILRKIIENRMYTKSRNKIMSLVKSKFEDLKRSIEFNISEELQSISFSKGQWFDIIDNNLIDSDRKLVVEFLKKTLMIVIESLKSVKGRDLSYKYFDQEGIFMYLINNIKMLRDLNLEIFFLEIFLLL
ncbi:MAG: hypothetical protein BAJALOKI2v1_80044 [Promethearchaeota archaeon]|nr:MAG: hypothetical protein BAJALOKI2v1_80044 [Candidatus Lokiarchaeota archaeon]